MEDNIEILIKEAKSASDIIKSYEDIRLISHNDCDGICSASIMAKALHREGKNFTLSFVKQLDLLTIQELSKEKNQLTIFTDLGSGYLENLQKHIKNPMVIIDHHQTSSGITREDIFHFNPLKFEITEDIAGSGLTYLVARAMHYKNRELSELAIIGGIGDSQIGEIGPHWGMLGLNKEILKDAQECNKIRVSKGLRLWGRFTRPVHKTLQYSTDPFIPGITGSESASIQFLNDIGIKVKEGSRWRTLADLTEGEAKKLASGIIMERIKANQENPEWIFGDVYDLVDKNADANEFSTLINACGKLQKPYLGVAMLLNDKETLEKAEKIMAEYRKEIGKAIQWIQDNANSITRAESAYFIYGGNNISDRFISNVVSTLYGSFIPKDRPVFAFADSENNMIKISARAGDPLVEKGLNLKELLVQASKTVDGEGGGHAAAAGAVIPKGSEDKFINVVNNLLTNLANLNKSADNAGIQADDYGRETGEERETNEREKTNGREGKISAPAAGPPARAGGESGGKEMERKGLVRYFGS